MSLFVSGVVHAAKVKLPAALVLIRKKPRREILGALFIGINNKACGILGNSYPASVMMFYRKCVQVICVIGCSVTTFAQTQFINFDDRPATNYAGNIYNAQGVSISTTFFPSVPNVGNIITAPPMNSAISIVTFPEPFFASPPNALFPENVANDADLFFEFSTPVTSLSFYTDFVEETPDVITLLGLANAGGGQYIVVDRFDYDDSATTVEGSFVTRDYTATPITAFAWLSPATDTESIDNLTFKAVPEPAASLLFAFCGLAFFGLRTKRTD